MKKHLHFIALFLILACVLFAGVSCSFGGGGEKTTSGEETEQPTQAEPTLSFPLEAITAEQYETADLSAVLANGEGAVIYTSDAPDVVKVEGARFLAIQPGTAHITARVESLDLTATCTVTVTAATVQPAFSQAGEIAMYYGAPEQLDDELLRGETPFTLAEITYATEGDLLSVDAEGNLTALGFGSQDVVMTARIGEYLVAEKTVRVTISEYGEIGTGIEGNAIALTATAENEGSIKEYELDALSATVSFAPVADPVFTIVSDNTDVAIIDGRTVKAVGVGTAHITVTFASSQAVYDSVITVTVGRETLEATVAADFLLITEGRAAIDASKLSVAVDLDSLEKVLIGGEEKAFTLDGSTILATSALVGEQPIRLIDAQKIVAFDALIADYAISTAEEFRGYWAENQMNLHEYVVLANDIDMAGASWNNYDQQFSKVFDGLGHKISNFTMGWFLYRPQGGTIKNVSFENYGCGEMGVVSGWYHVGLIMENVHFKAYQTAEIADDHGVLFFTMQAHNFTFRDCTFEITAFESNLDKELLLFNNDGYYGITLENVTVIYTGLLHKFGDTVPQIGHGNVYEYGQMITAENLVVKDIRDVGMTYDADYLLASDGKLALQLAKFDKELTDISAVKINGTDAAFTLADGVLTVDCAAAGNISLMIIAGGEEHVANLVVADLGISTAEQFRAYFAEGQMHKYRYVVILNDIDLGGEEFENWTNDTSFGVVDGLGHTVSNFYSQWTGLFYKITGGGVLKNLNFDNYGFGELGAFGGWYHSGLVIENVHMNAYVAYDNCRALLYFFNQGTVSFKDCTINITAHPSQVDQVMSLFYNDNYYQVNLTNVKIKYTGLMNKVGENNFATNKVSLTNVTLKDIRDTVALPSYVLADDGKIEIVLSAIAENLSGVTAVTLNGSPATFTEADGVLTVDCAALGSVSMTIVAGGEEYDATLLVADYAITTAEQFRGYFSEGQMDKHHYVVIANDIDMQGASWNNYTNGGFSGVVDGLGHTVSNFSMGWGLFYKVTGGGTVKNLTLDNFGYGEAGIFGGWYHEGECFHIENVTVNAYQTGTTNALLFWRYSGHKATLTNCTFNIRASEAMAETPISLFYNENYYQVTLTNVTVSYTGILNKVGENDFATGHVTMTNVVLKDIRDLRMDYDADYVLLSDGKIALQLNKFDKELTDISAVKINGSAAEFSIADGVLTVDCSAVGSIALTVIANGEELVDSDLLVADYAITTAEQFKGYWSENQMNLHEYVVLANDIDMGGISWNNYDMQFSKTFDGRGHKISNFTMSWFIYRPQGGTIKNVSFENYGFGDMGVLGGWYLVGLTMENVHFKAYQMAEIADDHGILFFTMQANNFTFRNCTFEITAHESNLDTEMLLFNNDGFYAITLDNVSVTYTGKLHKIGDTVPKIGHGSTYEYGAQITATNLVLKDIRDFSANYDADYVLASEDKIALQLNKFDKELTDISAVKVNGSAATYAIADGVLTVDCAALGNVSLTIVAGGEELVCNLLVADYAITTAEQFQNYFKEGQMDTHHYVVIANDIDMNNAAWTNYTNGGFSGVVNGLGHTVSNFSMNAWGLFYKVTGGGTVKNLTLDNFGIGQNGIFGGWYHEGECFHIENVTVNGYLTGTADALLFNRYSGWKATLTNCTFNITASEAMAETPVSLFHNENYYDVALTNVTVNYTGILNKVGENDFATAHVTMTNVTLIDARDQ